MELKKLHQNYKEAMLMLMLMIKHCLNVVPLGVKTEVSPPIYALKDIAMFAPKNWIRYLSIESLLACTHSASNHIHHNGA